MYGTQGNGKRKRCKSGGENLKGTKRCKETNEKKHLREEKGMLGGKNASSVLQEVCEMEERLM